ncbi:major facilitator superfamily domain-containing protein [Aspergillus floccosus]
MTSRHMKWLYFELPVPCTPDALVSVDKTDLPSKLAPCRWSTARKFIVTGLSCISTLFASFAAGCYTPALTFMAREWHVSETVALLVITTCTLGFALGPMVQAPLSEAYGRKPVLVATSVLFTVCQFLCSRASSLASMLVVRFFVGVSGSCFTTIGGGIIADVYPHNERNTPMAIFSGSSIFGIGLGPLIGGLIAQRTDWRWIAYVQTICAGMICASIIFIYQETYGPTILRRKANMLNKWYEELEANGIIQFRFPGQSRATTGIRWKVAADAERQDFATIIQRSIFRPFRLLFTELIVFLFSLWMAFSWSILFVNFSAIPLVYQTTYGFSLSSANAVFAASCLGCVVGTLASIMQERIAQRWRGWNPKPEHQLFFSCIEGMFLPLGLFAFGWTADCGVHWSAPAISIGVMTLGIFSTFLAIFNFLADSYGQYAGSALAAQNFCRNILGGFCPILSRYLFNELPYGPAASVLGGCGALLTTVPWILVFYGPQIRARNARWVPPSQTIAVKSRMSRAQRARSAVKPWNAFVVRSSPNTTAGPKADLRILRLRILRKAPYILLTWCRSQRLNIISPGNKDVGSNRGWKGRLQLACTGTVSLQEIGVVVGLEM